MSTKPIEVKQSEAQQRVHSMLERLRLNEANMIDAAKAKDSINLSRLKYNHMNLTDEFLKFTYIHRRELR